MSEIKIALFGIGGFATNYVHAMTKPFREGVRLVGAVDPFVKECPLCPVYATSQELYQAQQPDLVVIATPIHLHVEQAVEAFRHGCHVVMEKPIAATVDGVRQILAARDQAGKVLSIGFQHCYDKAMRALKADVDAGVFGAPVALKAMVLWPRDHTYYHRGSGWAGKRLDAQGRPIFDNVLSNATAHYLMNMLFMTDGPIHDIRCATYRANPIETFDTAVLKARAANGAEVFIAVSHAAGRDHVQNPMFEYAYEQAVVRFGGPGDEEKRIVAAFADGRVKDYGRVGSETMDNLWNTIDAIREGTPIGCTGEMALWHVDALEQMRLLQPEATPFPASWVREDDGLIWVPGLAEALCQCFAERSLPCWDLTQERLMAAE